jgi:plastocyanin
MAARKIQRSMLVVGVLVLWLMPGVAGASGGGGCGAPVTDATGASVEIDMFCFSPTILRTEPGVAVTFTNIDPTTHNVLGAHGTWGTWDALKRGREISFRFAESGVFPYVCAYHPGMVGVVVVGDGVGGAIGTTTKDGPVTQVSAKEAVELLSVPVAATEAAEPAPWPALVLALAAAALVVGVVLAVRRGSRRRSIA